MPVESGALSASIKASTQTKHATQTGVIKSGLPYAPPLHWGWPAKGIKAQPFLAIGAKVSEPTWLRVFEDEMNALLGDIASKVG